eukprot:CAMPEP_0197526418 /NCGR_PEP_ID=MMETSP1318-20131121/17785_1 /TAXON_ID=552666 /ORGANISM="Partenskyella glossopodia, Strain RCC365" /LENGTH=465 /DNA_ID=CAMNT_0043080575 /DNA_START=51 /DNA_END=1448 /DNA_ORIENTATION=+
MNNNNLKKESKQNQRLAEKVLVVSPRNQKKSNDSWANDSVGTNKPISPRSKINPSPEPLTKGDGKNAAVESAAKKDGEQHKKEGKRWKIVESFDNMDLKKDLLHGVYSYGFENPSVIQQRAIVPMIEGNDIIAQAQSGTGKTGAFVIGSLQIINKKLRAPQVIVLSPVRELARQTHKVASCIGDYLNLSMHLCVGGTRIDESRAEFRKGVHFVSGTPGRVLDMIRRKILRTKDLKLFVIDEADEMLSHGFRDQVYDLFQELPNDVQVGLFSATMPTEVLELSERFLRDPVKILIKTSAVTLDGIKQFYVALDREEYKLPTLLDLYEAISISQSIIFVNTRRKVDMLADYLREHDYSVGAIHGDMEDSERNEVVKQFRSGATRVLLSTDVLARGIDFQGLNLVLNYDLPGDRENYIHRIGRCGRFGRNGAAINFVTERDVGTLRDLEKFYNTQVEEMPQNIADLLQ